MKLYKLIEETIPELAVYLSYLKMNENSYQEKYEEYKNEIKDRYKKDQKAISFMNSVYNGNVNNALYNYFLSYGPPSFEDEDLLTFDEFSEYINIRKQMTRELIDFSRIQFEDYESLVKCRRKNN